MDLKCEHCGKEFNTNTGLYNHKEKVHKTPRVVLVSHNHQNNIPTNGKRSFPNEDDTRNPKKRKNEQLDDGLQVIDEYNNNVRIPKKDDQQDDELQVIDEYHHISDSEGSMQDSSNDISDREEERLPLPTSNSNYKKLYEKCIQNHKKMRLHFKKKMNMLKRGERAKLKQKLDYMISKRNEEITEMKDRFRKQMKDFEQSKNIECNDRISKLDTEHQDIVRQLNSEHKEGMDGLENECEKKIKHFQDLIKDLQDDDTDFTRLSNAIFNCTTIEEIFEIQHLIKNHQLNELTQNHLKTIQNLLLSLSYGIIPICDSQRQAISQSQRQLVDKIQRSSASTAKKLMKEGRKDFVNLFTIINGSLKLVRDSFNQYSITNP